MGRADEKVVDYNEDDKFLPPTPQSVINHVSKIPEPAFSGPAESKQFHRTGKIYDGEKPKQSFKWAKSLCLQSVWKGGLQHPHKRSHRSKSSARNYHPLQPLQ